MREKQKRFCVEYLIDGNATQAAIRAGYSPKTAYSIGEENLRKPEIRGYISEKLEEMESSRIADVKEVMEYFSSVLRSETESEVVVIEGTGNGISKAVRLKKRPDEKERLKAGEQLLKRYNIGAESTSVSVNVPIIIHEDLSD